MSMLHLGLDFLSLHRLGTRIYIVLVMTDLLSCYTLAVPTKDQTVVTTVKALWTSLIKDNRACECFNQTLLNLLGFLDPQNHSQWHTKLPGLLQAYSNSTNASRGLTPHYVLFGWHAWLPMDVVY